MDSIRKILFWIFFTYQNIQWTTSTIQPISNYDITNPIQKLIGTFFQSVDVESMSRLIKTMDSSHHSLNLLLEKNLILDKIQTSMVSSMRRELDYDFYNNKMRLTIGYLQVNLNGYLHKNSGSLYVLSGSINFYNISIDVIESSTNGEKTLSADISYSKAETRLKPHAWLKTTDNKNQVENMLKSMLPNVTLEIVKTNPVFLNTLKTTPFIGSKKHIVSLVPDFLYNEQKYFYFISDVKFPFFKFENLSIWGLSNFQSFKSNSTLGNSVHTLVIRNIRGNLILQHFLSNVTSSSKASKLSFIADWLEISLDSDKRHVNVEARDYRVIRTESDCSLNPGTSAIIMHYIESAIASSIAPLLKVWRKYNQQEQKYDKENIKQMLDGILDKKGSYDYQISFHNVTVKLISGIPYPQEIQCVFPRNLNITHRINAKPVGNLRLNNGDETININFHVNFTSIQFSAANSDNSLDNDTCEFQIRPNEAIKVKLPNSLNMSEFNDDELKLKEKIDQTLISMVKDRLIQSTKLVACSPFNLCTKSLKAVDYYFSKFTSNLLEKCSLRTNTNSTNDTKV